MPLVFLCRFQLSILTSFCKFYLPIYDVVNVDTKVFEVGRLC